MAKVTELERASGLGSELRPSDSNPERLRQEIGRTVPPGALLCTGLSPDKEVSGEEEPGTKKICADVENRKWRQLGFSQPPEAGSTGNPAEGQAGQERGPREPPSRCVRLCARCWAAAVPTLQDLNHPGRRPSAFRSPGWNEILKSPLLEALPRTSEERPRLTGSLKRHEQE